MSSRLASFVAVLALTIVTPVWASQVKVLVISGPSGAVLFEGDQRKGETPLTLTYDVPAKWKACTTHAASTRSGRAAPSQW
jgi:hypothetical protein